MIAAKNPAGIHLLLFITTLQRGGTCEAHGIGAKLTKNRDFEVRGSSFFTLLS